MQQTPGNRQQTTDNRQQTTDSRQKSIKSRSDVSSSNPKRIKGLVLSKNESSQRTKSQQTKKPRELEEQSREP
jgi:hypothetical protein